MLDLLFCEVGHLGHGQLDLFFVGQVQGLPLQLSFLLFIPNRVGHILIHLSLVDQASLIIQPLHLHIRLGPEIWVDIILLGAGALAFTLHFEFSDIPDVFASILV